MYRTQGRIQLEIEGGASLEFSTEQKTKNEKFVAVAPPRNTIYS